MMYSPCLSLAANGRRAGVHVHFRRSYCEVFRLSVDIIGHFGKCGRSSGPQRHLLEAYGVVVDEAVPSRLAQSSRGSSLQGMVSISVRSVNVKSIL